MPPTRLTNCVWVYVARAPPPATAVIVKGVCGTKSKGRARLQSCRKTQEGVEQRFSAASTAEPGNGASAPEGRVVGHRDERRHHCGRAALQRRVKVRFTNRASAPKTCTAPRLATHVTRPESTPPPILNFN
jgi:hypothetical protein